MFYDKLMRGFFMEADGGESGDGSADITASQEPTEDSTQGGEGSGAEPPKEETKMYTAEQAQAMIDSAMRRKLKNMPSKEELADFRAYKESQQSEAEKIATALQNAENEKAEAAKLTRIAEAKLAALDAGVTKEHIDDAVILAMAKASDDAKIEEAMAGIAKSNPAWTQIGVRVPDGGGNPPQPEQNEFEMRLARARKDGNQLEVIRIKQEASKEGVFLL